MHASDRASCEKIGVCPRVYGRREVDRRNSDFHDLAQNLLRGGRCGHVLSHDCVVRKDVSVNVHACALLSTVGNSVRGRARSE
jgi:hypothetical protein